MSIISLQDSMEASFRLTHEKMIEKYKMLLELIAEVGIKTDAIYERNYQRLNPAVVEEVEEVEEAEPEEEEDGIRFH